jgi:hypothetical protein
MLDPGLLATVSLISVYVLLVDSLYAEAIEAEKARPALPASSSELIWILGKINSEAKL